MFQGIRISKRSKLSFTVENILHRNIQHRNPGLTTKPFREKRREEVRLDALSVYNCSTVSLSMLIIN